MITTIAILSAAAFLYWKRWLSFTQTGVLKPLVNLTLFGVAVSIKKPVDNDN